MTVTGSPSDVVYGSFAVSPAEPLNMSFDARSAAPIKLWVLIQAWDVAHKRVVYQERYETTTSSWSRVTLSAALPGNAARAAVSVYAKKGTWQIDNLLLSQSPRSTGASGSSIPSSAPKVVYSQDFSKAPPVNEIRPWHPGSKLSTHKGLMTVRGKPADLVYGAFEVSSGTLTFGLDARSSKRVTLWLEVQAWDASGKRVVYEQSSHAISHTWTRAEMQVVLPSNAVRATVSAYTRARTWDVDNFTITAGR